MVWWFTLGVLQLYVFLLLLCNNIKPLVLGWNGSHCVLVWLSMWWPKCLSAYQELKTTMRKETRVTVSILVIEKKKTDNIAIISLSWRQQIDGMTAASTMEELNFIPSNPSFIYGPSTKSHTLLISIFLSISNFHSNRFSFIRKISFIYHRKDR
ncbi:hypothetical protein L2E82_51211 [Cichorium intybus]|nr:hypothetical protein L2E82_51211 [Cichorium intybus]